MHLGPLCKCPKNSPSCTRVFPAALNPLQHPTLLPARSCSIYTHELWDPLMRLNSPWGAPAKALHGTAPTHVDEDAQSCLRVGEGMPFYLQHPPSTMLQPRMRSIRSLKAHGPWREDPRFCPKLVFPDQLEDPGLFPSLPSGAPSPGSGINPLQFRQPPG